MSTIPIRRPTLNPVLRRELIERWRGRRAFTVLTSYLGVLVGLLLILAWAATRVAGRQFDNAGAEMGPLLGRFLFDNLFALVLLLVLFVGPGYAAAQIAGERERRTLGLLQITLVSPWGIVLGKLGAAAAWLLLLVLTAAPMAAIAFFLGGVTVGDLLRGVVYLVVVTVALAALGIGVSSLVRRTTAAIVITYGLVLVFVVGTLFVALVETAATDRARFGQPPVTLQVHPFVGLADATGASLETRLPSILSPFAAALPDPDRFGPVPAQGVVVLDAAPAFDRDPARRPVWLLDAGLYAVVGVLAVVVASRRVRPEQGPRRRAAPAGERTVTSMPAPPPPPPAPREG